MKDITIIDNKIISLLNDSMRFLSENTQRAYKSDLHTFLSIVNKEIQKTTMKDLNYYFSELEKRNYRNSTINRKINSLSKIFTIYKKAWIIKENLIRQINNAFCKHTGKKGHPHCLRHFFATYKIGKEKKDVKAVSLYLGHSTTSITLSMYVNTALKPEETVIIN